jgi:hypothetical protein
LFFVLVTVFIASIIMLCVKVSLLNFVFIIAIILAGILRYELATRVFPSNHIIKFLDSAQPLTISGEVVGFPHKKRKRVEAEFEVKEIAYQDKNIANGIPVNSTIKNFWLSMEFMESLIFPILKQ